MKKYLLLFLLFISLYSFSQKKQPVTLSTLSKPKLVVGIVLDQMRWDYLQRFEPLFATNGGFKRMMNNGFNCNNTMLPYTPTVTACGHTCIYTGSVPNIHGIVGNDWIENGKKRMYCTQDDSVQCIGNATGKVGKQSPKNMLVTTICDELKLATNFKSKVIGIAAKDRGAILPAGHNANAAYWYNKDNGAFITSSHYMKEIPTWVTKFNDRNITDSCYKIGWNIGSNKSIYEEYCTADNKSYESKPFGKEQTNFPYNLEKYIGKDYNKILTTPYGNFLTSEFAKAAILNENLGNNSVTDFLTVSFSSTDYIGHSFGPNSWELLDCYIKIDRELGAFFDFLDKQIGINNYTAFLTADHAVAHIPAFLNENKLPGGVFDEDAITAKMNEQLKLMTETDSLVIGLYNYQVVLNNEKINMFRLDKQNITNWIINFLKKQSAISSVFFTKDLMMQPMNNTVKNMLANGYFEKRCGEIQFILKPGYIDGSNTGTTHGLWNPYDAHIPLLWYGWGIKKGSTFKENYMTDIVPTLAALLKIQMPSGCVGKVIEEILK